MTYQEYLNNTDDPTIVDIHKLDVEWQFFGRLLKDAGKELADAQNELAQKKAYIKFRRAELSREYRTGAKQLKDANEKAIKITEGALSDLLDSDKELSELENEVINLQYKVNLCNSYFEGVRNKKYGLQDEVRLYLSDYNSEPYDPSGEKQYRKKVEEVNKEVEKNEEREELKRRRRRRKEKSNIEED